ncbi:FG-GAP-like repeat-containing protein [Actinokineospora globicatena]|uniref:FG-GAP-like repeat-containing protein n=1 Tax=Actinokineospora globicatena TaxID=103729 RepID=UPI0020A3F12A|nr:FG-GAP-like repeat-containing protein [Actinokineospora globicatena]MCP2302997.1 Repeat domain-containing protein [Actinokineospora globicatena]GLW79895.1 hypothetical protein Aglo01_43760 [Actinokineospora globicatena]GLW85695.1 hypothetical protein Aglo02_33350 [Actinokineospora globicatena]
MNVKHTLRTAVLTALTAALAFSATGTASAAPGADPGRYQHEAIETAPRATAVLADRPITRSEVMARAKVWVDRALPYDNDDRTDGYRQDCSGMVSMAWALESKYEWTATLGSKGTQVTKAQLKAGDMLLWVNPSGGMGHVRIFGGWKDGTQSRYWVYEQTPPKAIYHEYNWADTVASYVPYRGNNVIDDNVQAPGASLSGDTKAELVDIRTDGTLQGWYNGNGFTSAPWTSNIPVGVGFADPARVKFADLSGDGRKELIYVAPDGKLRAWYNGNGFTTYPWTSELEIGSGFSDPSRVFFADISGDGRAELIHLETNGNIRGWYNGNGFTTAPWTSNIVIGTGFADPARLHFADLSGDGRAELVYNETNGDLRGWYNGNGFTSAPWTSNIVVGTGFTDPARTKFGDVSGDGRAEVVYVSPEGNLRAWYNGNGFTTTPWTGNEVAIGTGFTDPARVLFA